ncbi:hypothetical protein [Cryptosporangium aurantiacum]|uniref:Uncharacterized protein n=1 Tax=Cryptosporangium aurantiacum TaxID=134849 RepID=A0A1M7RQ63_9ACTN|nr:hypothetical protein [Cryptosporangium aurantiacum]SHN48188.1 hypothetical protein SAMN05443668_1366 [Cryptosporangium aurantiacum]
MARARATSLSDDGALVAAAIVDDRPPALPYCHTDPTSATPALVGSDGYAWLAPALADLVDLVKPAAVRCQVHGVRMHLDGVPLLYCCPRCDVDVPPAGAVAA